MMATREGYTQQPLGESEVFLDFQAKLSKVAAVNRSVLLVGERGSGKEIAARRLHYLSPRWDKSLITVNCAALPPSLIETELFGYEQGAFTGAQKTRKGRFEEAEGGTLFLDEIGLIPLEVQEKILRVVEYGTYERVGSSVTHEVNVRIIGATNANLPALVEEGKFKQDLLDRLSFEVLFLPPLRERGEDILTLAYFFASKMALECNREAIVTFSEEVIDSLLTYPWPGNVRELKNVIERAVYQSDDNHIQELQFDPFANPFEEKRDVKKQAITLGSFEEDRIEFEIRYLSEALKKAEGNQKEAAKLLGLTYDQLRGLYRKYQDRLNEKTSIV